MLIGNTRDGRLLAQQIEAQFPSVATFDGVVATLQPKSAMAAYVTNAALSGTLAAYVTDAALSGTLSNYVTGAALSGTLASYVTENALGTALGPYLTQASAETTYTPKNRVVQYETPTVGDTVVVNADTDYLILDPAGPLANVTLDFPGSPADQKRFTVACTRNVAVFNINADKTVRNSVTAMVGGGAFEYMYRSSSNAWFRTK